MIKIAELSKGPFVLKAVLDKENLPKTIIKKENAITEFADKSEAFIYIGKEKDFNVEKLESTIEAILNYKRDVQIDVKSFIVANVEEKDIVRVFVEKYEYKFAELYSIKTVKKTETINVSLINTVKASVNIWKKTQIIAQARN